MKRIAIGSGVLLATLAVPAAAMTFMTVDYVCPVGGERFSASTMGSGTAFGRFLDGRAYGAIQSPWPLVQCPGNGFVLFREEFSKAELKALGAYVQSDDYQRLRNTETSYWRLARLLEVIDAPAAEQASALQRASWQASPAQYPRYVAAASAAFARQCPDERADSERDDRWLYCQMLLGEWERRLSRFEPARARFLRLQPQVVELLKGEDNARTSKQFAAEIAQQLQLIAEGNAMATMAVDADAPAAATGPQPDFQVDAASAADAAAHPAEVVAITAADAAAMAADAAAEAAHDAAATASDGDR